MEYLYRNLTKELENSVKTRPLTYLNGGRQVGKSTLCANLSKDIEVNQITFDSPVVLASARNNPEVFINSLPENTLNVIDEVQAAPEIFPYLKMKVDKNRLEGNTSQKFLLTGSANLMALPTLSEALVGRMDVLTLYPFCAGEFNKSKVSVIGRLFNDKISTKTYKDFDIVRTIEQCTYPEIALDNSIDRTKWFDNYLTTILNRDVKSLSDLKNPDYMITLLSLLSMRTGGLLNNTELAKEIGIDYRTYEKLLKFGINSFMVYSVKPWAKPNRLNKRFVKSPKLYFTDCNFLSYIMKRDLKSIYENDSITFGHVFENFIASELIKETHVHNVELSHYRTLSGKEADFVLENRTGDVIGIEVKTSKAVGNKDATGLTELQEVCGDSFKRGYVVYLGNTVLPITDKIWAVPVNYFWE